MKKIISMLLVIAMMVTVLAVGIATTSAAETASITIYGLDGSTKQQDFNVGDEFTVYTTLDVSANAENGLVGSVEGSQTYSSDVLALVDEVGVQYGDILDLNGVFPITGLSTIANGSVAGTIYYNASSSSGFKFDSSYSKLIVTTYKVTAAGTGTVKNALENLALADEASTKIVYTGKTQSGKTVSGGAYFDNPVPEIDHAEVTIYGIDGTSETREFSIGDTFTVYTTLDASFATGKGMVSSLQASQKYTNSVLALSDEIDQYGGFKEAENVFPVTGASTIANTKTPGLIKYAAASSDNAFAFDNPDAQLIVTTYEVKANGYANITNSLVVLAAADEDATKIVFGGVTQPGEEVSMGSTFTNEAPTTLRVTIVGLNGKNDIKEFNVGDNFTVYTMLNTSSVANGNIASVDGYQTYPTSKLQLTDAVNGEYNEVTDKAAMFPILSSVSDLYAGVNNGKISFNATKPAINDGFVFNSDESKLIVTNYKVLRAGEAKIVTKFVTLVASDAASTKIVSKGADQAGASYTAYESYVDPSAEPTEAPTQAPTEAPTQAPTEAPTQAPTQTPTQAPTQAPTTAADEAVITIYGIDGASKQKTFKVGDTFTVYTTMNVSNASENKRISSISATQSYSTDILQYSGALSESKLIPASDFSTIFPNLGNDPMGRVADGVIRYNATTGNVGNGFLFDEDSDLLIVTKYTVLAAGNGEVRNAITTMRADDEAMTKIVNKSEVQPGKDFGSVTSFTAPGEVEPTEEPTTAPGKTFLLGDVDNDGTVSVIDALQIQVYRAKGVSRYEATMMQGDVDGDGRITIVDATLIQAYKAKKNVPYPIGTYVTRDI